MPHLPKNSGFELLYVQLRASRRELAVCLACMGGVILMQLPAPILTMRAINEAVAARPDGIVIAAACLAMLAAFLSAQALKALQAASVERLRSLVGLRVQRLALSAALNWPMASHASRSHGYMLARTLDDPRELEAAISDSAPTIIADVLTLTTGVALLSYLDWRLALVALSSLPAAGALAWNLRRGLRGEYAALQECSARMSGSVGESLANLLTLKTLVYERGAIAEYGRLVTSIIRQRFRVLKKRLIYEGLLALCTGTAPILVLWVGCDDVGAHRISVGALVAFTGYLALLFRPAASISGSVLQLQRSMAAAGRVAEVIRAPRESATSGIRPPHPPKTPPSLSLDGVWFRYPRAAGWALRGVCCQFGAGEVVAITGSTGSGKSTLVNLFPALLLPTRGYVRTAGIDTSSLEALRRDIALVSQETLLFARSVRENLCMGLPAMAAADLKQAAWAACAEDFVEQLPKGFETVLAESGRSVSAGQRQRLQLARALLGRPKVLVLDEATSCLDAATEREVLSRLTRWGIPLVIVVSHRPAMLAFAQRALRVEDGFLRDAAKEAFVASSC